MSAVFGVTYPGGVVIGSESHRSSTLRGPLQAQKVIRGNGFVFSAAGHTGIHSANSDFFNLHKLLETFLALGIESGHEIKAEHLRAFVFYYRGLLGMFDRHAAIEILVGVLKPRPQLLSAWAAHENLGAISDEAWAAGGDAKLYIHAHDLPGPLEDERMRPILESAPPPPPMRDPCNSRDEAYSWVREVIEWTCKAMPDTSRPPVQIQHLEP